MFKYAEFIEQKKAKVLVDQLRATVTYVTTHTQRERWERNEYCM